MPINSNLVTTIIFFNSIYSAIESYGHNVHNNKILTQNSKLEM